MVLCTGIAVVRGDVLWIAMGLWGKMVSLAPVTSTMRWTAVPKPLFLFFISLPVSMAASQVLLRIPEDDALMAALTIPGVMASFGLHITRPTGGTSSCTC